MNEIKGLTDEYNYYGLNKHLAPDETPEDAEGFFLTRIKAKDVNLAMNINLRCIENNGDKPFLRFQNDRNEKFNTNWIKIYLDGNLDNYENKIIVFTEEEMNDLKLWIKQNKDVIAKHYYQEYFSTETWQKLKPLKINSHTD
jgi:hypothetical protein